MKTRYCFLSIISALLVGMTALFVACDKDLNDIVKYTGKVVYVNTTNPFPDLEVRLTDGSNVYCVEHTDTEGGFTLTVKVAEISGDYYILVGDSTCIPKKVELPGYGQPEINLGTIEVEGPTLPVVSTKAVTNITDSKATSGGKITADGRSSVTARGVCWAKTEYPTIDDSHTTNGKGVGEFTSQLTGLEPGNTYYVRAYATNRLGTAYGKQMTLLTTTGLPQVTTDTISNISATSATCGGDVAANSGYPIAARGICWSSQTATPTTNNDHTEEVANTGKFSSMMIGLERNTTYYVRAYATNERGTNYGETRIFTTLSGLPSVTTAQVSEIKASNALGGGVVESNGGYPITARGVCWSSTSSTPNIEGNHTSEIADNGLFTSLMTNLETNTTYYVRAYATNEVGTSYGASVYFQTADGMPQVITTPVGDNITANTITSGGQVTDDGGFPVIARGVVYGTIPYPTIEKNEHTNDGSGIGYYGSSIANVDASANTYYIRAYATNEKGTTYGEQEIVTPEKYDYCNLMTMEQGGYTYKIKPLGKMSWTDGNTNCENMVYGGYDDWFMPNDGEVQGIIKQYGKDVEYKYFDDRERLYIEGESHIWTAKKGYSEHYYFYVTGSDVSPYHWQLTSGGNGSDYNLYLVFAVRKYRTDN